MKEAKTHAYIPDLLLGMSKKMETPGLSLRQQLEIPLGDPRLIAPTIAPHQPKPTMEIVEAQVTRFAKTEKKKESKPSTSTE